MDELINNLIDSINNDNVEEAIYWAHLLKQQKNNRKNIQSFSIVLISSIFKGFQLQVEELSSILSHLIWEILEEEDFPIILENFESELIQGLKLDYDENVKKLCIKIVFDLGLAKGHSIPIEVLDLIFHLINCSNYSVSSFVIDKIIKQQNNLSSLTESLTKSYNNIGDDSVIQFRYLELFQKLSLKSDNSPLLYEKFFIEIKNIFEKNDLVLSANVLQIIQDCIDTKDQFDIFLSEGIIDIIIGFIKTMDPSNILVSKSLDILADCSINSCFDSGFIDEKGLNRIVYNIEPITSSSVFCSCSLAASCPSDAEIISNLMESYLKYGSSSVQLAALHGLGIYFKSRIISSESKVSVLFKLSSFNFLTSWLPEKMNSTFDEQKLAAYFALKEIITSASECFKFVLNHSNIFANILERSLDTTQLGLKWKYGIIEDIRISEDLFNCLNDPLKEIVVNYLKKGINFIPKTPQVSFEGQ